MKNSKQRLMGGLLAAAMVITPVIPAFAADATTAPAASDIIITNYSGKADVVHIDNVYAGTTVKIYSTAGRLLATASGSASRDYLEIGIAQLGTGAGSVDVTMTDRGYAESSKVRVAFPAETQSDVVDAGWVTVVNNVGKADVITLDNITEDDTIKVYSALTGGKLLGSGKLNATTGQVTINVAQVGSAAGAVYITRTTTGSQESDRVKVPFTAELKSDAPSAAGVSIINNAGIADSIRVNYLSVGDTVKVYDSARGGTLLGTAAVSYGKTDLTITVTQLGKNAGTAYVTIVSKGMLESDRVAIPYAAENTSAAVLAGDVTITNNAGTPDTLVVNGLQTGDEIKVYDAETDGNQLATVTSAGASASLTVAQLGTGGGYVYLTRSTKGRFESVRTKLAFTAEPGSGAISASQVAITNASGKADTIKVSGLTTGDIVKVYSDAAGNTLLGTATVAASASDVTLSVTQLGTEAGSVWISLISKGKTESSKIRCDYAAESVSDNIKDTRIIVENNVLPSSDTIEVTGMTAGDVVRVYSAETSGDILTTGTVSAGATAITLTVRQLGTTAGSVWVSVTTAGKRESSRVKVAYASEGQSTAPSADNISVVNNANAADTVQVTGLTAGDTIRVYENAVSSKVLGTATVASGSTYAAASIQQLGTGSGSLYVSVTGTNKAESERVRCTYLAESATDGPDASSVGVVNNVTGTPDTVEVTGLRGGDTVKVYDAASGGTLLGTAAASASAVSAVVSIAELGVDAGKVWVTVTSINKSESSRTEVSYAAEARSGAIVAENVTVSNLAGTSDTITVTGVTGGDVIRAYDSAVGGKVLATTTVASGYSYGTLSVAQLGTTEGALWLTLTSSSKREGERVRVDYGAESQSTAPAAVNVVVTNNAGKNDTVRVSGLQGNDTVNVYDASRAGTLLGTATAGVFDSSVTLSINQLGSGSGTVYVSVISKSRLESSRTAVTYTAEQKTTAPDASVVTVVNNAGISDTVRITGLSGGETVSVFDAAGNLLVNGTAAAYDNSITLSVPQLGTAAGTIGVAVARAGYLESDRTKVNFAAETVSSAAPTGSVTISNNAGAADTVTVAGLAAGDTAFVYDSETGGTLMGSATVAGYDTAAVISIPQLGANGGTVYVSVRTRGKLESSRTAMSYGAEQKTIAPVSTNIAVLNYYGLSDVVEVAYLERGDVVRVYDAETGGSQLGTATAADSSLVDVKISQLGSAAGKIYLTVTSVNKLESSRTAVSYDAELQSAAPEATNVVVVNNAKLSDTLTVSYLQEGDVVRVYSAATAGTQLGTATAGAGETHLTLTFSQLGTAAGSVYVTVTGYGEKESARTRVAYAAEATTVAPDADKVTVVNNASKSDTITVAGLRGSDVVKVYNASSGGSVIVSGTVDSDSTEITLKVSQLGTGEGSVYIAVTTPGSYESSRVRVDFASEE